MQHDSLFGHLTEMFSSHPENVATEALNYILNHSSVARRALLQYAMQAGVELPETLLFRTQAVGDDNAIPDLVGKDSGSRPVLLIEAKFWAGLTDILRALDAEGELLAASDVQQLQGLCERMDSDAFLPLRSEEPTSDTGTRIRQYCEIVDEATGEAVAAGIA